MSNRTPPRPSKTANPYREYEPEKENMRKVRQNKIVEKKADPELMGTKMLISPNFVERELKKSMERRAEAARAREAADTMVHELAGVPREPERQWVPSGYPVNVAPEGTPYPPPGWNIPEWRKKSRKTYGNAAPPPGRMLHNVGGRRSRLRRRRTTKRRGTRGTRRA